jgi:hypothetical protein
MIQCFVLFLSKGAAKSGDGDKLLHQTDYLSLSGWI